MQLKRVVVTGIGALTPIGNTADEYWQGLINGVSGAAPITRFDASKFKTQFACEVKGFNPEDHFDRKEGRKHDLYSKFAMVASSEAVADSGINGENADLGRIGVIWGSGIGGLETFRDEVGDFIRGDGTPRFNPFFIPKMIADIASGNISIKHGYRGPNFTTVSACASSTNALADAFNYIRLGKADAIVTGGSEAAVNEPGVGGFNALHALSTRNDSPETASRPFDLDRNGFVLGEGAGAVILEEYEHAKARGAQIYAELTGYGATSDGYDMVAPSGEGAVRCMKMALATAKNKIDYINTHGTSTPVGDITELRGVGETFGADVPKISSTKSLSGHPLGAASVHEAIYCLIMMKNSFITGSANIVDMDDEAKKFPIVTKTETGITLNTVMSNSFGFGGTNAALIFEKV